MMIYRYILYHDEHQSSISLRSVWPTIFEFSASFCDRREAARDNTYCKLKTDIPYFEYCDFGI